MSQYQQKDTEFSLENSSELYPIKNQETFDTKSNIIEGYFIDQDIDTNEPIPVKSIFQVLDRDVPQSFDRDIAKELLDKMDPGSTGKVEFSKFSQIYL